MSATKWPRVKKDSLAPDSQRRRALTHVRNWWIALSLAVTVLCPRAIAQVDQFLPEVDLTYKLSSEVRASFQAKQTREGGEATSAEIGPSIEFYLKPLVKLKDVTLFDLDDAKSRPLVFSVGYRYLSTPGSPSVNRMEPTLTFHFPAAKFLLFDKTSIGQTASSRGAIATGCKSKEGSQFAAIIPRFTRAPNSFAKANTRSGATRHSMRAASFRRASVSSSIRTLNIRIIPASGRIRG